MKQVFLIFLVFAGISVGKLQAQDNSNSRVMQVTARAVIVDNLMLVTMRDLDLINPAPEGTRLYVSPLESSYAGQFRVQGSARSSVRVSYLIYEDIQEASGNGGMVNARYILSGMDRDNQFQSLLFAPTGDFTIQLSEEGLYYLWVGAELDLSRALPGEYFSEFIIEMEYI
jgi:hypothetical protein